jgi:hypothetical protein
VRLALAIASVLLAACATAADAPLPAAPVRVASGAQPLEIAATPVALDPADPRRERVGELVYAGGVALSARGTSRFGGISGLDLRDRRGPGEGRAVAVTDGGDLLEFDLVLDARGRLTGVANATLQPLLDAGGRPLEGKTDADAEGLIAFEGDDLAVSFERRHRVLAYDRPGAPATAFPWSGAVPTNMESNMGLEALAHPPASMPTTIALGSEDGRIWLCSERRCAPGAAASPLPGYSLTGMDGAPADAGTFAVFRAFDPLRGFRWALGWSAGVERSAPFRLLARFEAPLLTDNFEAVAVTPRADGWRLYVASDDNFSRGQRTLLLAFDWSPPKGQACPVEARARAVAARRLTQRKRPAFPPTFPKNRADPQTYAWAGCPAILALSCFLIFSARGERSSSEAFTR